MSEDQGFIIPAGWQEPERIVEKVYKEPIRQALYEQLSKKIEKHYLSMPLHEELYSTLAPVFTDDYKYFDDAIDEETQLRLISAVDVMLEKEGIATIVLKNLSNELLATLLPIVTARTPAFGHSPIELFANKGKTIPYDVEYKRGDTFARLLMSGEEVEAQPDVFVDVSPWIVHIQALSIETAPYYRYVGISIVSEKWFPRLLMRFREWINSYES